MSQINFKKDYPGPFSLEARDDELVAEHILRAIIISESGSSWRNHKARRYRRDKTRLFCGKGGRKGDITFLSRKLDACRTTLSDQ
ncbi:hypothetical protein CDAR_526571 [Caerostris darwini]|uniref:Uncharacterized protein n=1 Tax=Caerostris darwini TaxID=1538125 RepID=A0AAV4T3N5_9ARAC|nr:hypothetical protein CDAR_526571 [Caerostris darwini]